METACSTYKILKNAKSPPKAREVKIVRCIFFTRILRYLITLGNKTMYRKYQKIINKN